LFTKLETHFQSQTHCMLGWVDLSHQLSTTQPLADHPTVGWGERTGRARVRKTHRLR